MSHRGHPGLHIWALCGVLLALAAPGRVAAAPGQNPNEAALALLDREMATLDTAVFDAYNRCDLETFAGFFAPDVEFYHDQGGVTWTRQAVIDATRKNICGKVRRELVPGTLHVSPVKDYGAIVTGAHRFCELSAGGKCEGLADFVSVWRHTGESWVMTRVLSFGHRPNPPQ
jgi:hypothetical protein